LIWIIGGTSETREFLNQLPQNLKTIITVTTEEGRKALSSFDVPIHVAQMDEIAMAHFIEMNLVSIIVDLSHPYAVEVSKNAIKVSQKLNLPYFRFVRSKTTLTTGHQFNSIASCATYLKSITGTVFFTTGIKSIPDFEPAKGKNRFIYRILPSLTSFKSIENLSLDLKNIVAMHGPFSIEMNSALFRQFKADYVVMKNAGITGGTEEKLQACILTGAKPLMIDRPNENGFSCLKKLKEALLENKE